MKKEKWVVAVCCFDPECLSNMSEFISNHAARKQPTWSVGIVDAVGQQQAFLLAEMAFAKGLLTPPAPNTEIANWYTIRLPEGASIPEGLRVLSFTRTDIRAYRKYRRVDDAAALGTKKVRTLWGACGTRGGRRLRYLGRRASAAS